MGTGLWSLGAVQPLLDLLGRNPAFFVAADASPAAIVVFVILVAVAVPLLVTGGLAVVQRLAPKAYPYVVAVLVAGGAALVGFALGRNLFPHRTLGHLAVVVLVTKTLKLPFWGRNSRPVASSVSATVGSLTGEVLVSSVYPCRPRP